MNNDRATLTDIRNATKEVMDALAPKARKPPKEGHHKSAGHRAMRAEFNPVLYWYLLEAPGLLGETSSHEAIVLMIQSGGSATTIASSDPYHESIIDRLDMERADPVAQARRCDLAWSFLCPLDRRILRGR